MYPYLFEPKKTPVQASSLLPGPSLPREQLLPSVLVPELDLAFGQRQERPAPPRWLAEFLSNLFTTVGPRGLEFAMASIDRAVLRNLVCLEVGGGSDPTRGVGIRFGSCWIRSLLLGESQVVHPRTCKW